MNLMKYVALFIVVLTLPALADESPKSLGEVKGVIISGLVERHPFNLLPGTPEACERKVVSDWLVFHCSAKNVSLRVDGFGSRSHKAEFDKLSVFFKSQTNGDISREYYYRGTWIEEVNGLTVRSKIRLTVWYVDSNPKAVRGVVEFEDLGMSLGIQGTRQE